MNDGQRKNPWTTKSSRPVYENPWIRVREDEVIRPDGEGGIYGVVSLKNVATGVIAMDEAGRIALVGQWRYPLEQWSWEIPEGGAPEGEDPLDAAKRELREETGITAGNWRILLRSHISNCVTDEVAIVYLATRLDCGVPSPDPEEELEVRWVSFDEAIRMVEAGEITDAVSQLGILAAARAS